MVERFGELVVYDSVTSMVSLVKIRLLSILR
jgi:hypothetical protein